MDFSVNNSEADYSGKVFSQARYLIKMTRNPDSYVLGFAVTIFIVARRVISHAKSGWRNLK